MGPMALKPLPKPVAVGAVDVPSKLGQAYVYRAYCRCGDLLYVGVADDLFRRLHGHRRDGSPWEPDMVRLEYSIYRTRVEAERVERAEIRELHPLYNKTHAIPRARLAFLPWPRALSGDELDRCSIAAYRGTSYLGWLFSETGIAS